MIADKDLVSIQQARILAENAFEAQKKLAAFPQEKLDAIVEAMAAAAEEQARRLAALSHDETDMGHWEDKWIKNQFVCSMVRNHLRGMRCVGVLSRDEARHTMDVGVPLGVIVAFCPVTSPVSTTIYTCLLAVKSGNSVIFSPHPRACKSIRAALDILIEAAEAAGLPQGCLSYLDTVAKSGSAELMNHPATSLIMITGVPGMLEAARHTGKPLIYGNTGNGPVFIERSADIQQAAKDIIRSKTFDNGIAPSAEHSIVVDACVAQDVRQALKEEGAYFMSEDESLKMAGLFYHTDGRCKFGAAGLPAPLLARRAGFSVPDQTRLLLAERKYISDTDPYCRGIPAPVLAFYVEDDWMNACEKCIELLLYERNAHTMAIHSKDEDVILQFALKKPVGRLLVNTPAALGGLGATTNLFPAMTLGSGSAGFGITSDNVSPMNLIYVRKVGYGVRQLGTPDTSLAASASPADSGMGEIKLPIGNLSIDAQTMQRIVAEAIKALQ